MFKSQNKNKMKNQKSVTVILFVIFLITEGCAQAQVSENQSNFDIYEGLEFDMPRVQEPDIPDYSVNIKDFGAVSGGQVLNSQAFAAAIEEVSQKGGGKVIIPAGIWLTGPIILKSNLELYTEPGALVIFSTNKDLYPIIETSFEGLDTWRCISPIYGKNLENIAITGHGVWDGSGDAWRFVKRGKLTANQWKELIASGNLQRLLGVW